MRPQGGAAAAVAPLLLLLRTATPFRSTSSPPLSPSASFLSPPRLARRGAVRRPPTPLRPSGRGGEAPSLSSRRRAFLSSTLLRAEPSSDDDYNDALLDDAADADIADDEQRGSHNGVGGATTDAEGGGPTAAVAQGAPQGAEIIEGGGPRNPPSTPWPSSPFKDYRFSNSQSIRDGRPGSSPPPIRHPPPPPPRDRPPLTNAGPDPTFSPAETTEREHSERRGGDATSRGGAGGFLAASSDRPVERSGPPAADPMWSNPRGSPAAGAARPPQQRRPKQLGTFSERGEWDATSRGGGRPLMNSRAATAPPERRFLPPPPPPPRAPERRVTPPPPPTSRTDAAASDNGVDDRPARPATPQAIPSTPHAARRTSITSRGWTAPSERRDTAAVQPRSPGEKRNAVLDEEHRNDWDIAKRGQKKFEAEAVEEIGAEAGKEELYEVEQEDDDAEYVHQDWEDEDEDEEAEAETETEAEEDSEEREEYETEVAPGGGTTAAAAEEIYTAIAEWEKTEDDEEERENTAPEEEAAMAEGAAMADEEEEEQEQEEEIASVGAAVMEKAMATAKEEAENESELSPFVPFVFPPPSVPPRQKDEEEEIAPGGAATSEGVAVTAEEATAVEKVFVPFDFPPLWPPSRSEEEAGEGAAEYASDDDVDASDNNDATTTTPSPQKSFRQLSPDSPLPPRRTKLPPPPPPMMAQTSKAKIRADAGGVEEEGAEASSPSFPFTHLPDDDGDVFPSPPSSSSAAVELALSRRLLRTIEGAARAAGKICLATAGRIEVSATKSNARDLVTESDVDCQRTIQEMISEEFPGSWFLGEEDVSAGRAASEEAWEEAVRMASPEAWGESVAMMTAGDENREGGEGDDVDDRRLLFVVDPIDGTTNFQAGLPLYAVSIGVVLLTGEVGTTKKAEAIAGVIYNPALGEMTSAVRGRGCYLNGRRIAPPSSIGHTDADINEKKTTITAKKTAINAEPSAKPEEESPPSRSTLGESLVNVGFPACEESTLACSSRFSTALATKVRGLRTIACASQVMSWVARSNIHAYVSWNLNSWDVAAGVVIVEECGGGVWDFNGRRANVGTRDMIVTCPTTADVEVGRLRDELIQVLEENDCLEY